MDKADEKEAQLEWESLSQEAMQDRRQGKRVTLVFPIEVSGLDRSGRMFCERTVTSDISEVGCRFQMKTQPQRGDVVAIKLLSRRDAGAPESKALMFRVAWTARTADGWTAGALQLQPENIWHVGFPPKNPSKKPSA